MSSSSPVARRYASNQSKYDVDGKPATFKEVGALLRRKGIDLDTPRFLILQGEVEQIAMMKPKAPSPHEEGLLESVRRAELSPLMNRGGAAACDADSPLRTSRGVRRG